MSTAHDEPLPAGPVVTLSGYAVRMEETILLFDTKLAADNFDVARCRNIGSDAALFTRLSRSVNQTLEIRVVSLGTQYAQLTQSEFAFWRIRGRRVQIYCLDDNLYWARDFQTLR